MAGTVLIPLDGSALSEKVVPAARPLIDALEPDVVLLRVVPREADAEADEASVHLLRVQERLARDGARVQARVVRGDAAEQILAYVRAARPDYLVMATHGRGGLSRLVRGSVAERVVRRARVPVLLVNPQVLEEGARPFRRILVPLDGSPLSASILPHVERLARVYGSEVLLLRVEPFTIAVTPSPVLEPPWDPRAIEASLEEPRRRLEQAGIPASVMAAYGGVAVELLRAARDCDLVAMSTHGRGGPSRWWFGSVAEQVVRHCATPLLVLRPPEAEGEEAAEAP